MKEIYLFSIYTFFSLDATNIHCMGKMVNDSPEMFANAKMKKVIINENIHLCLYAIKDINKGTEIR